VTLAVLHSPVAAQKYVHSLKTSNRLSNNQSLHYKRFAALALCESITCQRKTAQIPQKQRRVEKDWLVERDGQERRYENQRDREGGKVNAVQRTSRHWLGVKTQPFIASSRMWIDC
jgi:hypothetical protein